MGGSRSVSRLARSFLLPAGKESHRFVFYAYLYFGAADEASRKTRVAAASAVLTLFSDVRPDEADGAAVGIAMLYIPITTETAALTAVDKGSGRELVAKYDYERARQIRKRVENATHAALPRVALIAHDKPLDGPIDLSQLYIVDLDGVAQRTIEETLRQFSVALESDYVRLDDEFLSWAKRQAQSFFENLAGPLRAYP